MPSVAVGEFFSCPFSALEEEFSVFAVVGGVGGWFGVCGCEGLVALSLSLGFELKKENISEKFESSFINLSISSEFFRLLKSGFIAFGKSGC